MSGFVANYMSAKDAPAGREKDVMGFYTDRELKVYDFLANHYVVCDRWFCSHPGPTYPNRFISLMGTTPNVNNIDLGGAEAGFMKGDTIFDVLTRNDVSWKYVESNIAFLRMFDRYRLDEENIIQRRAFIALAKNGRLPSVTWIDPNFGELEFDEDANDDHPPADVRNGQGLVCDVYDALTANIEAWRKTLFVITYDEHGGFYDHVPPHEIGTPDGPVLPPVHRIHADGTDFCGVRVPAFLVSPAVRRRVSSTVLDHTSILKTILVNFIGPEGAQRESLGKRVDGANELLSELDSTLRADIPPCPRPDRAPLFPAGDFSERFDPQSFHLSVRLFPFGFKVKRRRPV